MRSLTRNLILGIRGRGIGERRPDEGEGGGAR